MADKKVPPKVATSVPKAKTKYTPPDQEKRSASTQAAADRFLHGKPTNPDGTVKGGGRS